MAFFSGKKEGEAPYSPLWEKLRGIDPFTLEQAQQVLEQEGVSFLLKQVTPEKGQVEGAIAAVNRQKRRLRSLLSLGALLVVAAIYLVDFIRDPSYYMALVLAAAAGGIGVFLFTQPARDAKKTAVLYCQNTPSFSLCLWEEGIAFTDGDGQSDLVGKQDLLWVENQEVFACLARGRGLVYFPKGQLTPQETQKLRQWTGLEPQARNL